MKWCSVTRTAALLGWLSLASTLFVCPAFSNAQKIRIETVEVEPSVEGVRIQIRTSQPFTFVTYTLSDPNRLIVDLTEEGVVSSLPEATPLDDRLVKGWRVGRLPGTVPPDGVDYLSFELTGPAEHLIESNLRELVLRVRPKPSGAAPVDSPRGLVLTSGDPYSLYTLDPIPDPPQILQPNPEPALGLTEGLALGAATLHGALEFGLSRHRPVQISRAEAELALLKLREARRALYPSATLKASWTDGTASGTSFRETSYGIQMEQPLYSSGRLMETYRQAIVNLQVAEKRGSKVKADFSQEIAQAFFQMIGAKMTLKFQEDLVEEAADFFEKTQTRFDEGLLTRLEMLNVEAQVNQAKFQRVTAENDLLLARIKLLQRLNLDPNAAVDVPEEYEPFAPRRVDLEDALQLSARYRPDIQVNTLLVQFHEMEERIAKAKGKLKVDLSGFIGSSGSAFETEPLDLGNDYFVGVKATQAWGPHGATISSTTTKTSPRLGQTTRTDSTVTSGELGILNQLQGFSEIQQAKVNLEKALNDLQETKANVYQEVREAIISLEKAALQLEYAEQKVHFRKEQVKILKTQASLNEVLPSQVLEAVIKLTEEKVGEIQAMTNYQVALAKLNKAIGLPEHYR